MYMLDFSKDNRTASFMINTDDSELTSVLITVEGEE